VISSSKRWAGRPEAASAENTGLDRLGLRSCTADRLTAS
jgi:hypothetical protein